MNVGDRVDTPAGPATVTAIHDNTEWTFGNPHRTAWIIVTVDGETRRRVFPPADVVEQEPSEPWPA